MRYAPNCLTSKLQRTFPSHCRAGQAAALIGAAIAGRICPGSISGAKFSERI